MPVLELDKDKQQYAFWQQDLVKTIEKEHKAEEDLYEAFVCWGKSIISQKTETNAAAASRIDMLEAC